MWIPRTSEEVQKWHEATQREAHSDGLVVAIISWLAILILLAGGWMASGRLGVIAQDSIAAGSFWTRFPIFALGASPFGYWLYRREKRRGLERALQTTICPKCETSGEGNDGAACQCGGAFVLQSSVRWDDGEPAVTNEKSIQA